MEWERQRREQLMAEKQREQAHVDELRAEVSKLNLDLETLVRLLKTGGYIYREVMLANFINPG